ncbi:hypothetical protein O6H91_13G017700 [Diphasiastrum complanatum]|uniref:Uncharacterized protein n=2 Tax=Diphasiastrum complanatum TaxID=34168 RepID=A0ACC2BSK5_DIPCM|nr:hypothetical protein O6H91_13G017700 [Diphasiastrum complanatum]KAJ7532743.1 hypothetical protein O6H91_13G017700 [Diphasiastrum complanatum]
MEGPYTLVSFVLGGILLLLAFLLQQKKSHERSSSSTTSSIPRGYNWTLPFFGETFDFLKDPHNFHLKHIARFGETFYASLFGENCIVVTTPEASKWVLQTAQHYFRPGYPRSVTTIVDATESIYQPQFHSRMRKIVGSTLYPEALQNYVKYIDAVARISLSSWKFKKTVNLYDEMKRYTFFVASKILCSLDPGPELEEMALNMEKVKNGFLSLHIDLPFTRYHAALKARDALYRSFKKIIDCRRNEGRRYNDMLEALMLSDEPGQKFSDAQLQALILSLMFAGYETTSAQLVWAMKRLHDNPEILEAVKAEHDAIRKSKLKEDSLNWGDIKEMKLTLRVIYETMRTSHLDVFIPREPLQDLEYDGSLFPRGWKIHASISAFHLDPKVFPDPYKFDPSRFENGGPPPNTYMPFGNGNRKCLGSEIAKTQMLILIHHIVSNYRWEAAGPDQGIQWWAVAIPKGGYPIRVQPR